MVPALLGGLLAFGLYPYDFLPANRVEVLPEGFSFEGRGMVLGDPGPVRPAGLRLAMDLTPSRDPARSLTRAATLLDGAGAEVLTVSQWGSSVEVGGAWAARRAGIGDGMRRGRTVRIEIAADEGKGEASLGVGAEAVRRLPWRSPAGGETGVRLLLGNSPDGARPWHGRIERVSLGTGAMAWEVPRLFLPLRPRVLAPFPEGGGWRTAGDAALNLAGFIPWGFFLAASLSARPGWAGRTKIALAVVGSGLAVSLAIELLQVGLPGRTSSLVDLALNTAGTAAGLVLHLRRAGHLHREPPPSAGGAGQAAPARGPDRPS